ncbi:transposase [Microbacterium invictum]|uniref:Chromosome segregation ATPase n=1 Tax=Microbacterium invictum TaxID=515415 RepID=A0AA40SQ27_9MICO|nr:MULTISPECIES: transposase [Microbacterium]MBB4140244.1 chromosome segregation ATPase [Microbacterium invictum]
MATSPELNGIAAELYALAPDAFTAARNARAKEAEDSAFAAEIRALRKPLVAAWVVNLFAREHAGELTEALELAEALREAQADLDAATLTTLSRERRALVRSLAKKAGDAAAERGERITVSTLEAVVETLNAAMFDGAAAAAVASGRLVRPLQASGSDAVDLAGALAGDIDAVAERSSPPADEVRARRERKEAERALRSAESRLKDAMRRRDDVDRRWQATAERARELSDRAEKLEAELARVEKDAVSAHAEAGELDGERTAAADEVVQAERAAEEARLRVDG